MRRVPFDRGWRFHLGDVPSTIWRGEADDSDWTPVDLPHDWSIGLERDPASPTGGGGGYFPAGVGWYQKRFAAPEDCRDGTVLVEFEGVYMNAEVWLDEHFLGRHPYGYTSFHHDLTPYIEPGSEHALRVLVDNGCQPNSRWYSGSGIYRHVWLWVGGRIHVPPHGLAVTTPAVSQREATVRVATTVAGAGDEETSVRTRLVAPDGRTSAAAAGPPEQELAVAEPELWSPDAPRLYRVEVELLAGGRVVDAAATTFGIRSLELAAETGLRLNGEPLELRGGCVHHDNGPLGAASHDRAEERKAELLKASGFNAVRCAHNPPAPAFLDACDRLGLLVIDEAFDCWRNGKAIGDYHVSFDDWWRRDLESMVVRDRNHPSVIMWSIGNEVVERARPEALELARLLAGHVRALDPTRPVTAGVNRGSDGFPWEQLDGLFEAIDVCGYNYEEAQYRPDRARVPGRVVYGSESKPLDAHRHWASVVELEHVIGDFVWTALDYLGESGIGRVHFDGDGASHTGGHPWHQANCGDLDLCGFKRPQSYYRDMLWRSGEPLFVAVHAPVDGGREPTVTAWGWPDVRASWTWPGHEGRPLRVDVYSTCSAVELLLDGESLGTKFVERCLATFEVPYRPGTLRAIGPDGEACELRTAGRPARLRLTPDRDPIGADDLCYVTVEVLDESGLVHPDAGHEISFDLAGEATIAAVGSGDPTSTERYAGMRRSAYRGRCLVILRSRGAPGEIHLAAEADGLAGAETAVRVG